MKLHLTYPSSEEGIKLIKLYKYLKHNDVIDMTYDKNDFWDTCLEIAGDNDVIIRRIRGYDNIRIALKSIFPTLFDLTPIKRVPIEFLRSKKLRNMNSRHPHIV